MSRRPRASKSENHVDGNVNDGTDDGAPNGVDGIVLGETLTITDPTSAVENGDSDGNDNSDLTPTGRRKRKYSKRNSSGSGSAQTVRVDIFEQLLFSTHMMLSAALKTPEIALAPEEAKAMAEAYAGVAQYYPVLQQSEKAIAITNLIAVTGMIYGTRAVALWRKKTATKENEPIQFPFRSAQ